MTFVIKTADESVSSSTVLQADNHLKFTADALALYEVVFVLGVDGHTGGDIKLGFDMPFDSEFDGFAFGPTLGAASDDQLRRVSLNWYAGDGDTVSFGTLGTSTRSPIYIRGSLRTGNAGGDFGLEWAQNVSNATSTRVKYRSYLRADSV
ncbi:hypothetical protein [Streptosporangium sp. CA-115845]|uniref:hypothetical protein n=1 Tax=Streptosporangium sp. CA-115845 TaxID=3240071 RepID=UPI003D8AF26E